MQKNKITILLILMSMTALQCKVPTYNFSYENNINKNFFNNVPALYNKELDKNTMIDSIKVYACKYQEVIVIENSVAEITFLDSLSKKDTTGMFSTGTVNRLYFFDVFARHTEAGEKINLGVFMSLRFNSEEQCTRIAPSFLGLISDNGNISFEKELMLNKTNGIVYGVKKLSNAISFFKQNIQYTANGSVYHGFKVVKISKAAPNKLSGNKEMIFDVKKIFNDENSLIFLYKTTIK